MGEIEINELGYAKQEQIWCIFKPLYFIVYWSYRCSQFAGYCLVFLLFPVNIACGAALSWYRGRKTNKKECQDALDPSSNKNAHNKDKENPGSNVLHCVREKRLV